MGNIRLPFLLILLLSGQLVTAQNMIQNGGFEYSAYDSAGFAVKANTTDLNNWGAFGYINLHHHNYCGGRAYSGINYIDIRLYSQHIKNYREYAEAKIGCQLLQGHRYIIRFRAMPIKGRYLVGNLGLYLSKIPIDISAHRLLKVTPQVKSPKNVIIDKTNDYTLIEDTIIAQGGEQYIIIGNFNTDHNLPKRIFHGFDTITKNFPPFYSAIYAFDEIELIPLDSDDCSEMKRDEVLKDTLTSSRLSDTTFLLNNIHFGFDSTEPLGEFSSQFELIKYLLNNDTTLVVKISGFTDQVGTANYNYNLSKKRAAAIAKRVQELGVDCHRIYIAGYGSAFPKEDSESKREQNRRVEIRISSLKSISDKELSGLCN